MSANIEKIHLKLVTSLSLDWCSGGFKKEAFLCDWNKSFLYQEIMEKKTSMIRAHLVLNFDEHPMRWGKNKHGLYQIHRFYTKFWIHSDTLAIMFIYTPALSSYFAPTVPQGSMDSLYSSPRRW